MRAGLTTTMILLLLPLPLLLLQACSGKNEEFASRIAARSLVAAPKNKVPAEMAKVVALGTFVLPDVEQEMHAAPASGRKRLIEAMRRMNSPESLKLLDFVARWDSDDTVRRRARLAAAAVRAANNKKQ